MSRYGAGPTLEGGPAHRVWPRRPDRRAAMVGRIDAPFRDGGTRCELAPPGLQCRCNVSAPVDRPPARPMRGFALSFRAMPPGARPRARPRMAAVRRPRPRRGRGRGLRGRPVRRVRAVHRRRPPAGRLSVARGARSTRAWTARRRRASTPGGAAQPEGSARSPRTGSRRCTSPGRPGTGARTAGRRSRVFEAPDLTAEWVHEFYAKGAEAGRNTEGVEASRDGGRRGSRRFRLDTLNGESYQTVIDWQDGDRVRVVLVASFIRLVSSKAEHEEAVQAALEAATGRAGPVTTSAHARNAAETPRRGRRRTADGRSGAHCTDDRLGSSHAAVPGAAPEDHAVHHARRAADAVPGDASTPLRRERPDGLANGAAAAVWPRTTRAPPDGALRPLACPREPRARVAAMTWSARRRAWEAKRLGPALDRVPERQPRFSTISDTEVERLYGAWSWQPVQEGARDGEPAGGGGPTAVDHHGERLRSEPGRWDDFDPLRDIGLPGEPPFTRGIHPSGYRTPALDDADVRGLRRRRGHEPPVQVAARGRPDRPVDRLRHADALRLRHRPAGGRGRVRDVRRRRQQPGRHGGPARRPAARPRVRRR